MLAPAELAEVWISPHFLHTRAAYSAARIGTARPA